MSDFDHWGLIQAAGYAGMCCYYTYTHKHTQVRKAVKPVIILYGPPPRSCFPHPVFKGIIAEQAVPVCDQFERVR